MIWKPPVADAPDLRTRGGRIRFARAMCGLTQVALNMRGVNKSALSRAIRGKGIRLETACNLSRALGVSLDWIAFGKDFPGHCVSLPGEIPEELEELSRELDLSPGDVWTLAKMAQVLVCRSSRWSRWRILTREDWLVLFEGIRAFL